MTPAEYRRQAHIRARDAARAKERYRTDLAYRAKRLEAQRKNRAAGKHRIYDRKRWQSNPARRAYQKALAVRKRYGVSREDYQRMWEYQKGACGVCRNALDGGKHTHVDHDHQTKEVRGLLCISCNRAEGIIAKTGLTPVQFAHFLKEYLANPPGFYTVGLV